MEVRYDYQIREGSSSSEDDSKEEQQLKMYTRFRTVYFIWGLYVYSCGVLYNWCTSQHVRKIFLKTQLPRKLTGTLKGTSFTF
ncbi:uncharacterized protein LOC143452615 isoform X5 [Clavelina lepadiformis]|uniref:uncharacterized protein LOC143452615 isoform X5 n=1 Tax=Clavelina lepadiformis TaxID=159417 RepID=UPI004041D7A3